MMQYYFVPLVIFQSYVTQRNGWWFILCGRKYGELARVALINLNLYSMVGDGIYKSILLRMQ